MRFTFAVKMRILLITTLSLLLSACGQEPSYVEIAPEKLTLPATEIREQSIVSVIESINKTLTDLYPEHPKLPIIIERSRYPNDGGDEIVSLVLPEQELGLRLNSIPSVHTHWTKSHNGFVIFKTWHLGVIDESAFDSFFPESDAETGSEQDEDPKSDNAPS